MNSGWDLFGGDGQITTPLICQKISPPGTKCIFFPRTAVFITLKPIIFTFILCRIPNILKWLRITYRQAFGIELSKNRISKNIIFIISSNRNMIKFDKIIITRFVRVKPNWNPSHRIIVTGRCDWLIVVFR